jgi:hypothetical protein
VFCGNVQKKKEGFLAPLGMTKSVGDFRRTVKPRPTWSVEDIPTAWFDASGHLCYIRVPRGIWNVFLSVSRSVPAFVNDLDITEEAS